MGVTILKLDRDLKLTSRGRDVLDESGTFSQRTFSQRTLSQRTFSQRTLSQRAFSQYLQGGHLANIQNFDYVYVSFHKYSCFNKHKTLYVIVFL